MKLRTLEERKAIMTSDREKIARMKRRINFDVEENQITPYGGYLLNHFSKTIQTKFILLCMKDLCC